MLPAHRANGIKTLTGADVASVPGQSSVTLQYNKTESRWYITGSQNFEANGVTASNGLTATPGSSGVDVKLGGTLSANTDVALNNKNLTFSGAGNVGIGTNSPSQKLDVQGGFMKISDVSNPASTDQAFIQGSAGVAYFGALGTQRASFGNSENYETLNADGGNIGIGTTNPQSKLSVGGDGISTFTGHFKQVTNSNISSVGALQAITTIPVGFSYSAYGITGHVESGYGYTYGIVGSSTNSANTSNGRAYGVYGKAGGATSGWNYGMFGELISGAGDGAGIYAVDRNFLGTTNQISGTYAGYFDGKVNINSTLRLNTLSDNSAVYTDGSKSLTTTAPSTGTLGYWTRNSSNQLYPTTLADKVGIGTSNPTQKLDIQGGYIKVSDVTDPASTAQAFIEGSSGVAYFGALSTQRASFGNSEEFETLTADGGKIGVGIIAPVQKLHVRVNNNGLNLAILAHNANGTESGGNAVGIGFINESNDLAWAKAAIVHERTAGYGVGKLHFLVNNDVNSSVTTLADARMTILPGGFVGIGTQNPSQKLDVQGGYVKISDVSNPAQTAQAFIEGANGVAYFGALSTQRASFGNSDNYETLTADDGRVGIGNISPSYKLDVNGSIRAMDYGGAGSVNVLIGDDAFLSDMDESHTVGIISTSNAALGRIRLGNGSNVIKVTDDQTGDFGGVAGFDFDDATTAQGILVEGGNEESGGFFGNGNTAAIWSPGDGTGGVLSVYDEDDMNLNNARFRINGSGTAEARYGLKTERHIRFYKRSRGNGGGGEDNLGNYDFCFLAGTAFRNSDSNVDEDDDYQCNVYSTDIHGSADYNENENEDYSAYFGYNTRPYWKLYSECYQDCSNTTCTAICINFDY